MENANVYSIQIDSGYYDVNKVSDVQGYDAGLVFFRKRKYFRNCMER